ncbi:hypothetical protein CAP35_09225 [Chitinophagaceae bacterium IBVUCB1]|nr:hypothetical protein CAP35_09225 [Chitinophagaceae bacterium IBVUCB1]
MNKILLYLIMLPAGLWKRLGADVTQLKAILSVKLKMDDRKPLTMGRPQSDAKKRKNKFNSTLTFIVGLFIGFMYIMPMIMFRSEPYMGLFSFYTMLTVLLTFGLISDFSNVLVDTRDKLIIFPKPVNDRTIFLSRALHIFIYFFRSVFPMSVIPWILWGYLHGWKGALWFPIPMLFLTFICLFLVMGCYMLLLKLSKPERFKDIIGYFQIAFSIIVFSTFYLGMPYMRQTSFLEQFDIRTVEWIKYTPTYWLAACWYWVEPATAKLSGTGWLSILAVITPFAMLWVTVKLFAPSFVRKLSAIDGVEVEPVKRKVKQGSKSKLHQTLGNIFNRTDAAKAGFSLAWLQTARSRSFKMKVYPGFAYVFVYFFYLFLSANVPFDELMETITKKDFHIILLYMTSLILLSAITNMNVTEQYKASWIYYSSPLDKPGSIMGGAFKALWVKYYMPFVFIVSAFVLYVWGVKAIVDIVLATSNVTVYVLVIMYFGNRYLPFSMPEQMKTKVGKTVIRMIFALLFMGCMGFAHFALSSLYQEVAMWLKLLLTLLSLAALWTLWDSYINTSWQQLKMAEDAA